MMTDVVIHFNTADQPWADWIAWQVGDHGYSAATRRQDGAAPGMLDSARHEVVRENARAMVVLSPAFIAAEESAPGRRPVIDGEGGTAGSPPILVRVGPVDPPASLASEALIDLVGLDEDRAASRLLGSLAAGPAAPHPETAAPGRWWWSDGRRSAYPAALPAIWNVPEPRNPCFSAREADLSRLAEAFASNRTPSPIQALRGMGGVGKTELAIEFAYRHADDYRAIWWLRAGDAEDLAADYAAFGRVAGLPAAQARTGPAMIHAVRAWLADHRDWLFIFDDVAAPDDLRGYLPEKTAGHILITSRHQAWERTCPSTPVDRWSIQEAADFLCRRVTSCSRPDAERLAESMKGLPLALELAAAYLKATGLHGGDYADLHHTRQDELWGKQSLPLNYPDILGTTLSLALEKIQEETPVGTLVLSLCAYLAPGQVPRSMLSRACVHLPEAWQALFGDTAVLEGGLERLTRYALVAAGPERLSMQRLVQVALRDRLHRTEQRLWSQIAVHTVEDAMASLGDRHIGNWPEGAALRSHARSAVAHAGDHGAAPATMARILQRCGAGQLAAGDPGRAEAWLRRSLAIVDQQTGADPIETAGVLDRLAESLHKQGKPEEAEPFYRRALLTLDSHLGPGHPTVAAALNNLALTLHDQNRFEQAERLFRQAWDVHARQSGAVQADNAVVADNLALVLHDQGQYDQAERFYRRALTIRQNRLGDAHADVAACMIDLAEVLLDQDKHDQAESLCRRALEILEAQPERDHPSIAIGLHLLAALLHGQLNYDRAEPLYRRALEMHATRRGNDHPTVAVCLTNLARLLHDRGQYDQAEPLYRRALEIREGIPDEAPAAVAICLANLARLLHDQGDHDQAEPLYRRALEILEVQLGSDHPDFIVSLIDLAEVVRARAGPQEARQLLAGIPVDCVAVDHAATAF